MKKSTLLVTAVLGLLLPAPAARAAPQISFLNPSGYTSPATISDVQDADGNVHLVAWAREIPSQALVEFEFQPAGQNAATFTAERVGSDTWEAFVPIPDSFPDGQAYTLRARLYRGVPGDAEEVANDEMTVEVNQSPVPPPTGETVELTYPDNGSRLGIFLPKERRPVTVLDFAASAGTSQVRAFYSLTAPGADPVWEDSCGSGTPGDQGFGKVRCTLEEGHDPLDVSAVAVVSNKTAPASAPNPSLDDSGDAHRVVPYLQDPSAVEITNGNQMVGLSACWTMTAVVTDQFARPVAAANVDVHADGPEDDLQFGSSEDDTDPFQAPDDGHAAKENARRCSDNSNAGQQGDHNNPGGDDTKHIESVDGTSNTGGFRFALRSDFAGGTFVQAWADVDADDLPDLGEATGGTQIGWGTPPPEPAEEVFLTPRSSSARTGACVAFEIVARRGGSPFNNANVDVHVAGPEPTVGFCEPSGGGARRAPESGGHVGDGHEDGTRHAEGETDASGRFVFGVTSPATGRTQVQVWIDGNDDDVVTGEPTATSAVTWVNAGDRSVSIESNRSDVTKGGHVRLSGRVEGDPACSASHTVSIQAKPLRGGRFGTVKTVVTDDAGAYAARIRMTRSRNFRAVTPANEPCRFARSDAITVRVRR